MTPFLILVHWTHSSLNVCESLTVQSWLPLSIDAMSLSQRYITSADAEVPSGVGLTMPMPSLPHTDRIRSAQGRLHPIPGCVSGGRKIVGGGRASSRFYHTAESEAHPGGCTAPIRATRSPWNCCLAGTDLRSA